MATIKTVCSRGGWGRTAILWYCAVVPLAVPVVIVVVMGNKKVMADN